MDINSTLKKIDLDINKLKEQEFYEQSNDLLKKTDYATAFYIMMELGPKKMDEKVDKGISLFEYNIKYLPELLKLDKDIILKKVKAEDEPYNEVREVFMRIAVTDDSKKEGLILELLETKLSKNYTENEISLIKDFLLSKTDVKSKQKYEKLILKVAKKGIKDNIKNSDLFNESMNKWIAHNEAYLSQSFYKNLHSFLALQDPMTFVEAYFSKYREDNNIANNDKLINENLYVNMNVPEFTYLIFLSQKTSNAYQEYLKENYGSNATNLEKMMKKIIKTHFNLLTEAMEYLEVKAQHKLINLMFEASKNKATTYILDSFIYKTNKILISANTFLLSEAYKKAKDKNLIKNTVSGLLSSKKKHVKAIAETLLNEWK